MKIYHITKEQADDIRHALGSSHPESPLGWRNYYNSEPCPHLEDLVDQGLMTRSGNYYTVTADGKALFGATT